MTPYQAVTHHCRPHYGDHDLIRPCCVDAGVALKRQAQAVAFTDSHPAVRAFCEREAQLTDAEAARVGELVPGAATIGGTA